MGAEGGASGGCHGDYGPLSAAGLANTRQRSQRQFSTLVSCPPTLNSGHCLSNSPQREPEGEEGAGGRTVRFERRVNSRASGLVRQMREHLQRTGLDDDVEVRCGGVLSSATMPGPSRTPMMG